jgi:cell division protein FtsW
VKARVTRRDAHPVGRPFRLRDSTLLWIVTLVLCVLGLVMVLSASAFTSLQQYGSPWSIFEHQVLWMAAGAVVLVWASRVDVSLWRRLRLPMLAASFALLVAVLVPRVGKIAGGSSRWIGTSSVHIQPSELMKLALIVFVADLVARRARRTDPGTALVVPVVSFYALAAVLIVRQPDLGTAIVLGCIAFGMLFAGGASLGSLAVAGLVLAVPAGAFVLSVPYQRARLTSFLNPFGKASGAGYQQAQSLVALGSGHVGGVGLGRSAATWGFLPNAHTDFIFAVIGNELGLVGSIAVLLLFGVLAWCGVRAACRSRDRFSALVAAGVTCWIVSQAVINIGGVVGVLPVTGVPLPFVSFGGSSIVVVMAATGILINIARRAEVVRSESSR